MPIELSIGDWGLPMGLAIEDLIGDWGLGIGLAIGDWGFGNSIINRQSPIQSPILNPIPNPQSAIQSAICSLQSAIDQRPWPRGTARSPPRE
jgi:hypothetical protein